MSKGSNDFDVAIVGAGPAGAMSAILAARRGLKTLLVDKSNFPREKVCGCCINSAGKALLTQHKLANIIQNEHVQALTSFTLFAGVRRTSFVLSGGTAISRGKLDLGLVSHAQRAGCEFQSLTKASISDWNERTRTRSLLLTNSKSSRTVTAKVVVAACGLSLSALPADVRTAIHIKSGSRVGIGVLLTEREYPLNTGEIHMHLVEGGYVGFTKLENGQVDLAAAIDPKTIARVGMDGLFSSLKLQNLSKRAKGTPPLSRFADRVAWPGLFLIGDSAGYTEPFTGEGIGMALQQANICAPLLTKVCAGEEVSPYLEWSQRHRSLSRTSRWRCSALSWIINLHSLTFQTASLIARVPMLHRPLLNTLQHAGET